MLQACCKVKVKAVISASLASCPSTHTGLWISINWFVLNIGLVEASKQEEELFGTKKATVSEEEPESAAEGDTAPEAKKSQ